MEVGLTALEQMTDTPVTDAPHTTNPNGSRKWTANQIADIYRRASLKEPFSSIAEEYGTTKNAIAGMVKRHRDKLGIKVAKKDAKPKPVKKPATAPFKPTTNYTFNPGFALRPKAAPVKRVRLKLIENPNYVTFEELQPHHCRWPFGDPKLSDFRFCGCDRVANKPYCTAHTTMAGKLYDKGRE